MVTGEPRLQFLDLVDRDDDAPMDAHEARGVEPRLDALEWFAHGVRAVRRMQVHVVAVGLQPADIVHGDGVRAVVDAHHEPFGVLRLHTITGAGTPSDGGEEWDVFLEVSTFHVGGRVLITTPSPNRIEWTPLRGTSSHFQMLVEPLGENARLTMEMEYSLNGLLLARITELLVKGAVSRHLEAGLQEVRHRLEYGEK